MHPKNRFPLVLVLAAACLALLSCDTEPAALSLDNLTGWIYVEPNPVGVGQECTRFSYIYNSHETDTAHVDSCSIDTQVFHMDFVVGPRDTAGAVEEMNRTYGSAGTYVHTLTYYTTIGTLPCPPCTVIVQ